ncbi:MAG: 16S rRNA (cytidine1402-2'-O)-methyltransferase [Sphingobacteriales bacterium]|jgi:16S rRNA (cytidine1402-2'-O)-methyltransferase
MKLGKIVLIPTPIGNLEDITFRAIRYLKEADRILAEDTRTTKKLLDHYEIENKMSSFHQHNEHGLVKRIVESAKMGEKIVLVSDAGTPGISDPGFLLVREALAQNVDVECLPGATAIIPALVISGLGSDKFYYEGFLPTKKGRQTRLKEIVERSVTTVLYESTHRIVKLLMELEEYLEEGRSVSVSRELSKKFEETLRGSPKEIREHFEQKPPKGEFVCCIEGKL